VTVLFDTHLLLWAAATPARLPPAARALLDDPAEEIRFSAASIWEVAIKNGLGRADFQVDPRLLRQGLLDAGYTELAVSGAHAAGVDGLPPLHRDPFDRLLVAQAMLEAVLLVTADPQVARYPGPIRLV
jgi:PIN domain nuclease of toxin-antitoxin system